MRYIFIILLLTCNVVYAQNHVLQYEYTSYSSGGCYQALELDTISKTGRFYINDCYPRVGYAEMSIKIIQVNKDSLVFYPDDIAIMSVEKAFYGKGGLGGQGIDSPYEPKEFGEDIYNFTIYFKNKGKKIENKGCTFHKERGYETSIKFQSQLGYNILLFGLIEWLPPQMKKVKKIKWERLNSKYKERFRRFYEDKIAKEGDIIYTDHDGITFEPWKRAANGLIYYE